LRFETMPSRPILQAWAKMVGPSPSMSFEEQQEAIARARVDAVSGGQERAA